MRTIIVVLSLLFCAIDIQAQRPPQRYALEDFDSLGCMAKGRSIDCGGAVMQRILQDGKAAIPVLISQISETEPAKHEIADYWGGTQTGDIAFILLNDLFSDDDGHPFSPSGAVDWEEVSKGCTNTAQSCWILYLRKHGRKYVQDSWERAWGRHKSEFAWNPRQRYFQKAAASNR